MISGTYIYYININIYNISKIEYEENKGMNLTESINDVKKEWAICWNYKDCPKGDILNEIKMKPIVLLLGDSHAEQWTSAVFPYYKAN